MKESEQRKSYREACRNFDEKSGACRGLSKCGHGHTLNFLCTPTAKCCRLRKYDREHNLNNVQ